MNPSDAITETTAWKLAQKADLLMLAVQGIENIVNEEAAPVSLCDVAALKGLAEEIRRETAGLAQFGESIERIFERNAAAIERLARA